MGVGFSHQLPPIKTGGEFSYRYSVMRFLIPFFSSLLGAFWFQKSYHRAILIFMPFYEVIPILKQLPRTLNAGESPEKN